MVCISQISEIGIQTSVQAGSILLNLSAYKLVKLATLVEGDQKAPFSIATTLRYRGGRNSIPWIDPLSPLYVPYIAEC